MLLSNGNWTTDYFLTTLDQFKDGLYFLMDNASVI